MNHQVVPKPAIRALVAFAAGIAAAWCGVGWWIAVAVVAIALVSTGLKRTRPLGVLALVALVGWVRFQSADYSPIDDLQDETRVDFHGIVTEQTVRHHEPTHAFLPSTQVTLTARGWITPRDGSPDSFSGKPLHGAFTLRDYRAQSEPPVAFRYGTRVVVQDALLTHASPRRNPRGFDGELYMKVQGVDARLSVASFEEQLTTLDGRGGWFWMRPVADARARLLRLFEQIAAETVPASSDLSRRYADTYAPLFAGVLLGEKRQLPDWALDDFIDGGVVHVLVVSGANFIVLAVALFSVLRAVRVPNKLAILITAPTLWMATGLFRFEPQVVRAAIMVTFALIPRLLERDTEPSWTPQNAMRVPHYAHLNYLAASALLILMFDPFALFDIGFQLSFGAAASILYLLPKWNLALEVRFGHIRQTRFGKYLWTWGAQVFLATAAAQIVTTPLVAWHFQRVDWAGLLANIPVVILIELITVAALLATVFGLIWLPLGVFFGGVALLGFRALLPIVHFFASLPGAHWMVAQPSPPLLALYGLAVFAMTHPTWFRLNRGRVAILVAGCAACVAWYFALKPVGERLEITFIDVGQGDATFIRLPDGKTLLIDAGAKSDLTGYDTGERAVVPYLLSEGASSLDWLVLTHPDLDHYGGMVSVLETLEVRSIVGWSDVFGEGSEGQRIGALQSAVHAENAPYGFRAGDTLYASEHDGKPLSVEIIYPFDDRSVDLTDDDRNDDSLVVMLTYGDFRALLTGDIERGAEASLIERSRAERRSLRADVVKMPHHGSKTSSGAAFIEAVDPQLAVASAGVRNRYGHPAEEVVARYERLGVETLATNRVGAVTVRTDGRRVWVSTALAR
ncbi:MAG: DNA internalization-related competence protein ComEC/Rec2 [Candidatus Poribacteria bacterium]|nr:DNA internalization-related competence protein ComEC/Rec2 [Candidatus Poribacteria bacterium]